MINTEAKNIRQKLDSLSPELLNKILTACGPGRLMYVGAEAVQVVQTLLRRGLDAFGVIGTPSAVAPLAGLKHLDICRPEKFP